MSPGPVTAAIRAVQAKRASPLAFTLKAWPVIPAACLVRPAMHGSPGFGNYASQVLGLDATLCIIACLTVSPLVTVTRMRAVALRTWYGLWTFILGAAGLAITVSASSPGGIADRAAGDSVNWTGLLAAVLLLPLAVTSNKISQKLMGPEWKRWQRGLVWAVWAVILAHLISLMTWGTLAGYSLASLPVIWIRKRKFRDRIRSWRREGYSGGRMWVKFDILFLVYIAGMSMLIWREVTACAAAAALTPAP